MALDPKKKYLISMTNGQIYPWSERFAAKKEMRAYDPVTGEAGSSIPQEVKEITFPVELQGKPFRVSAELRAVLDDMSDAMDDLKKKNKKLNAENNKLEVQIERLKTDVYDLEQQLTAAKTPIYTLDDNESETVNGSEILGGLGSVKKHTIKG